MQVSSIINAMGPRMIKLVNSMPWKTHILLVVISPQNATGKTLFQTMSYNSGSLKCNVIETLMSVFSLRMHCIENEHPLPFFRYNTTIFWTFVSFYLPQKLLIRKLPKNLKPAKCPINKILVYLQRFFTKRVLKFGSRSTN